MSAVEQAQPGIARSLLRSPALLFLLWAGWLTSPYLLFGARSYCRSLDNADSVLALALTSNLGPSEIGQWWNPLLAGGQDAQTALQVPESVRWLFLALPGWLAYGVLIGCQRFVAGYFLYRLLRDELVIVPWAAAYGGLTYALCSQYGIDRNWPGYSLLDGFGFPGIPFLIWALAQSSRRQGLIAWLAAVGLGSLLALAWTYPFGIFVFPGCVVWFAAVKPRKSLRFWALLAVFTIGWLLANALPIWTSILNAPLSHRAHWDMTKSSLGKASYYHGFMVDLLSDNVVPIVLLSFGLICRRFCDRRLNVLAVVVAGIFVYLAAYHLIHTTIIQRLGFLSGFNCSRVIYVAPMFLATAAAAALPCILGDGEIRLVWRKRCVATGSMAVLFGWIAILLTVRQSADIQKRILNDMCSNENYTAFFRDPELLALARSSRDSPPFRVATVWPMGGNSPAIHPAMLWTYGLPTADGYLQMYPERYHRFWGQVIRGIIGSDPWIHDYFLYWGNRIYLFGFDPPEDKPKAGRFSDYYDLELLSLVNVRFLISPVPLTDDRLRLVERTGPDLPGAGKAVADQEKVRTKLVRYLRDGPQPIGLFVYENREVIPRIFFAHRTRLFDEPEQLLTALGEASRDELASTAFLLRDEAIGIEARMAKGVDATIQLKVIEPERIVVLVSVDQAGTLVVTQNFSPFWKVRTDGAPGRVIPVDHAFQGVSLEPGRHEVELTYRPPYAFH